MAKKLLNWNFSNGNREINIGVSSSDHLKIKNGKQYFSDTHPLNQVGALAFCENAFYVGDNKILTDRFANAFYKSGYGSRVAMPLFMGINVPFYLNGDKNESYIFYGIDGSGPTTTVTLKYHNVNTGEELDLFSGVSGFSQQIYILCGELYEDGTFTGDVLSTTYENFGDRNPNKYYPYYKYGHYENLQLIRGEALALFDKSPSIPEGEYVPEGVGDFNSSSDNIELPDLPTLSAIDTRMLRVYRMTSENLSKFNKFLWSDLFDINTFKKLFTDPMQAVLNLNISPINVDVLGLSEIKLGNINTGVQGEMCQQQYQKIDFGTIRLNEYWASFADYSPYTRLSIYLPYVGVQSLSIDDVMNGTIQLVGYCDVLTGSILYVLKSNQVNRAGHSHNSVLYSWGGNCQYQIPLTANNMSSVISSITGTVGSVAGAIGATVATGGLTAPIAVGAIGSAVTNTLNAKTQIQRGGGVGGATGLFGVQRPYLILERPEQRTIQDFSGQIGNPADVTDYLGNFSGFVKVKAVHVENVAGATEVEQTEIERLLKDGVII